MEKLFKQIQESFPQLKQENETNQDSPYLVMSAAADWVITECKKGLSSETLNNIKKFSHWCNTQPRSDSANDDIYTIYITSFFEELCENEITHPIVIELITKDEFIRNEEYLTEWIGMKNFSKILKLFN